MFLIKNFHPAYSIYHAGKINLLSSYFSMNSAQIIMLCGISGKPLAGSNLSKLPVWKNSLWLSLTSIIRQWIGWLSAQSPSSWSQRQCLCIATRICVVDWVFPNKFWSIMFPKCCIVNSCQIYMPKVCRWPVCGRIFRGNSEQKSSVWRWATSLRVFGRWSWSLENRWINYRITK